MDDANRTLSRVASLCGALVALLSTAPATGHHGVASLGAIALEGPGAAVETAVSAGLPDAAKLAYLKLDYAKFKTYTPERDDETDFNAYWLYGFGYGISPSLSAYVFLPFTSKVVEDNSFNTTGIGDISVVGSWSFKYDRGWRRVPPNESLDDWYDWHFTVYAGLSLPTGDANLRDSSGSIDPGQSLGFGRPSYLAGVSATRLLSDRQTLHVETSYLYFQSYRYADDVKFQFGDEWRLNLAWVVKLATDAQSQTRWDGFLEANALRLGRDKTEGRGELASGGSMLYLQPGARYYVQNLSFALGIKIPVWTHLNEETQQQGAEGRESYRLQFSASAIF